MHPLQKSNALKSVICVRNDDEALLPLYRHLSAMHNKPGKRYRARTLCTLLELGSCLLFAPNDPITDEFLRAAKSIAPEASESLPMDGGPMDGGPIRVELVLPETRAMRPLLLRLSELPGGRGAQARSQMVLRALHAGVGAVYRDRTQPQPQPQVGLPVAPNVQQGSPADMLDFIDNIEVEGLA
jgi:hypothetical protein